MAKVQDPDIRYIERKRWLFLGLPFTFTRYIIKDDMLTINEGFFKKVENDCYMYKIQDMQHTASLAERIIGLGTITCFTGDTTHPLLKLVHIRHSKDIKNYMLDAAEKARIKRKTLNTLNIGAADLEDMLEDDM